MFGTHDLALFIVTALVLNATPGVDMLYTLTRTFQHGLRGGLVAALGISSGCVVHALAAALGLAAILATSALAFNVVKWAGAAYLLWLALGMLRDAWRGGAAPAPGAADTGSGTGTGTGTAKGGSADTAAVSLRRIFLQGFVTNVLNPKVALFFLALLPQFIDAGAANKPLAFLFLGAVFIVNGTLFLFALVALAARARRLGASPLARRVLNAAGGALFLLLAARLAQTER
jgi:threonine/homoserine/homoserine lactone efflux protein